MVAVVGSQMPRHWNIPNYDLWIPRATLPHGGIPVPHCFEDCVFSFRAALAHLCTNMAREMTFSYNKSRHETLSHALLESSMIFVYIFTTLPLLNLTTSSSNSHPT